MSKPSILIVAGSFSLPEFYDEIINGVERKGYEITCPHLPSVGLKTGAREGKPPTLYDDMALIAKEVEKLADAGKDVLLIGHSYGGTPMIESVKGLRKGERKKQGKKGGIVRLSFITALVPAVGLSAGSVLADVPEEYRSPMELDVGSSLLYFSFVPFPSFNNH